MSLNDDDAVRERLLDAVVRARSDDDGPRLVYADWLIERGDPQGELIVVQCTRERCERLGLRMSEEYRNARARERVLLTVNVKRWVDVYGLRRWWGEFSRGFIARLTISTAGLRAGWSKFSRLPLEHITLHGRYALGQPVTLGDLAWLAHQPFAHRIELLAVQIPRLGTVTLDAPALIESLLGRNIDESDTTLFWPDETPLPTNPFLSRHAQSLVLDSPLSEQIEALVRALTAGYAPSLRSLGVGCERLGADDIAAITSCSSLSGLRELSLHSLEEAALNGLISKSDGKPHRFTALEKLALVTQAGPGFSAAATSILDASDLFTTVQALRTSLLLDRTLVDALTDRAPHLTDLALVGNATKTGLRAFSNSSLPKRLRALTLTGGRDRLSLAPLVDAASASSHFQDLATLSLSNFEISDETAMAMAKRGDLASVVQLWIFSCSISKAGARALMQSPHLAQIVELRFQTVDLMPEIYPELREQWPLALIMTW